MILQLKIIHSKLKTSTKICYNHFNLQLTQNARSFNSFAYLNRPRCIKDSSDAAIANLQDKITNERKSQKIFNFKFNFLAWDFIWCFMRWHWQSKYQSESDIKKGNRQHRIASSYEIWWKSILRYDELVFFPADGDR